MNALFLLIAPIGGATVIHAIMAMLSKGQGQSRRSGAVSGKTVSVTTGFSDLPE